MKVVINGTHGCMRCGMLETMLNKRNDDITKDPNRDEELIEVVYNPVAHNLVAHLVEKYKQVSFPIVEIDGKFEPGFDPLPMYKIIINKLRG